MRAWHAGLVCSFVSLVASCSTTPAAPPDQTVAEFCADWAKAICQISSGSCQFDVTVCSGFQTSVCMSFVAGLQQTGNSRQYSQPNGKACIDALNGAYGNNPSSISADTLNATNATCTKVVVGNQVSDKPCTDDNDCASGLVCTPYNGGKLCGPLTLKDAGDPCGDPGDSCQGNSYCAAQAGAAPQCVATPATGGACSASIPCGTADRCLAGTCQARASMGGTCATSADCASPAAYCDTYPPAACTNGFTFARGSIDCNGILGADEPSDAGTDAPAAEAAAPEAEAAAPQAEAASDSSSE
jgi:hypothetical protein